MSLCSDRWHTGQNVGYSLVRMRQLSAGRNMPLAEYPPPSYTPTGYFACSLTGVGMGVPLMSISSHLEAKSIRVLIFCSQGSISNG